MTARPFKFGLWLQNALFRGVISGLHLIPYERRLATMSWLTRRVIGPVVGYRRRAMRNLAFIYPQKSASQRTAITERVLDTVGRSVMENYSREEFRARIAEIEIEGPGLAAAQAAREAGQGIIFTCGHWSNHEATRTALDLRGFKVGGLYRPMTNPYFNEHYVDSIENVSGPVFPKGKEGTREFIRFIATGGSGFLLHDVYFRHGQWLDFLGQRAKTAFSAAELAIKLDALLIPYFNTRQPDGVSFRIELGAPIVHREPREMMRELTDMLEAKIAGDPGQWLWIHRRWKENGPS